MALPSHAKLLATVLGLALSPVYLACLSVAVVYRILGGAFLSLTNSDYAGQLSVLESFFDRERGTNLSVINVVCLMKLDSINTGEELRDQVVKLTERTLQNKEAVRLRCKIEEWMGLRYWQKVDVDIDKQIRLFDVSDLSEFKDYLSRIANRRIQGDRLWEILVSRKPVDGLHPVIMRGHHSVGDGYSLRQILIEAQPLFSPSPSTNRKFDLGKFCQSTRRMISLALDVLIMFAMAPSLCIAQRMRRVDRHSLRAEKLSGDKVLRWEKGDFNKLKRIQKVTQHSVTEILMAGFSKALDDLFRSRNEVVDEVTVVFPMRKSQKTNGLRNDFIPVGLKLPVSSRTGCRQTEVCNAYRRLRNKPNYRINYFIPRFASLLFPWSLSNWAYKCTETTSLFSNLPGAKEKPRFDGFSVESGFFFVPNLHDNNGMGVTFTSYDDQFIYSVILDRTLCRNVDDAQRIATGMKEYVDEVHASLQ